MKNWNFKSAVAVLMPIVIAALSMTISCDFGLTDNDQDNELEKLPPITQTGENTFGCLVNGEVFVVKNTLDMFAIYQGNILQFGGQIEQEAFKKSIRFVLSDPLVTTSYMLKNSIHRSRYRVRNEVPLCYYEYEDTFEGSIVFSEIDRDNYIISGTFEFSTVTEECDTVRITDGRFDMQYIP